MEVHFLDSELTYLQYKVHPITSTVPMFWVMMFLKKKSHMASKLDTTPISFQQP